MSSSTDNELLERIARADRGALRLLFERYHVPIHRFIQRRVEREMIAEELTNEVFLEAWRQAGRFRGRASVATWLYAIARNKACGALRRKGEWPLEETRERRVADSGDTPEVVAQKADKARWLRRAVGQLSPEQREVIDLTYYHRLSLAEIAQVVGIPVNTVKTRLFHARRKLRRLAVAAGIGGEWP